MLSHTIMLSNRWTTSEPITGPIMQQQGITCILYRMDYAQLLEKKSWHLQQLQLSFSQQIFIFFSIRFLLFDFFFVRESQTSQ